MRILAHSAVLLALGGCMSSSMKPKAARVKKAKTPASQMQEVRAEPAEDDARTAAVPEAASPEVAAVAAAPNKQTDNLALSSPSEAGKNTDTLQTATDPSVATPPPAEKAKPAIAQNASPDCNGLKAGQQLPFFLGEQPVLFLQFVKGCTTMEGVTGYLNQPTWTALGVPCTGGLGKIDKRGHEANSPSVVRFQVDLNCPMAPAMLQDAERVAQKDLELPNSAKLLALYPLTVEYWEIHGIKDIASKSCKSFKEGSDGITDAGVGSYPTLTDALSLCHWRDFTNTRKGSFPVRLYGRENSWNPSLHVYQVDALIQPENRIQYRIQVRNMRQLSNEESTAALERCKANARPRECETIFLSN